MSRNPDRTKQAQEIIFSSKKNATTHPPLFFNNSEIKLNLNQKHLGLTLDSKLSFIRSLLNYGDMINDQPYIALFSKKLNQVPYNVPLAITGANKGSSF